MHFAEGYQNWVMTWTDAPKKYGYFSALWIISTLIGHKVYLEQGDGALHPNLWMVLLGPSSFYRKTTILKAAGRFVDDCNPGLRLPTKWTTESFMEMISQEGGGHGYMLHSEFDGLMSSLARDYNSEAMSMLTELYDCPEDYSRRKGTGKEATYYRPKDVYLTFLGASTPVWLGKSIKSGDIHGGFLARFLFVSAMEKEKTLSWQPVADKEARKGLILTAAQIARLYGPMRYSEEAKAYHGQMEAKFVDKYKNHQELAPFYGRLVDGAKKLAMLEALCLGSMEIDVEACQAGWTHVRFRTTDLQLIEQELTQEKSERHRNNIMRHITERPGIKYSELLWRSRLTAAEFKLQLQTLSESNRISTKNGIFFPAFTELPSANGDTQTNFA